MRKAVSIDPRLIDAYIGLDEVLFRKSRLGEIIELWNQYIDLEPGVARAYFERSGTHYHNGDLASAKAGSAASGTKSLPKKIRTSSGMWSFLDGKGDPFTTEEFENAWDFREGKAKIRLEDGNTHYIDNTGKRLPD